MTTLGRLALSGLLLSCGVAGRPRAEHAAVPAQPAGLTLRRVPLGWSLSGDAVTQDERGEPLPTPATVWLYDGQLPCAPTPLTSGMPGSDAIARGPLTPTSLATGLEFAPGSFRSVTVIAESGGRFGAPLTQPLPEWSPPPPPPEAPLVHLGHGETVELTFLPPSAPATHLLLVRNGLTVAQIESGAFTYTDASAPPGLSTYHLIALGPDFRTGPSSGVAIMRP